MSHDTIPGTRQPAPPPDEPPSGGYPPQYPQPPYTPYGPYGQPTPTPPRSGVPWYVWLIGGVAGLAVVGMVACVGLAAALGTVMRTVTNGPEQQTTVERQFTVAGVPSISVRNVTGNITVVTGGNGTVQVQVDKRARDANISQARADLDDITVNLAQNGNSLRVDVQPPSGVNLRRQMSADVRLTVPAAATLDARTVTGVVRVSGVNLQGSSSVSLTTGNIIVDGSLADKATLDVRLVTGNATLTLPAQTAAHLDASTVTGNMQINGWPIPVTGSVTSHRASGDLSASPTGTIIVRVTTGNIAVSAR
jgi:predicted membrane protein